MLSTEEIRAKFLSFFEEKQHAIVPSAPIVVKDDPTLMFTNAGMNQFKDVFLGNSTFSHSRVADTQKCLRVSGKHNDLEEVGVDTYHHTMFEMLGNWSFGDYFKKEAIAYAWELLTKVFDINKDNIYVTVFKGDKEDNLKADNESIEFWKEWVTPDRILLFDRKDNFWEMGDTGPCGPCSEIHVDVREDSEKAKVNGATLVNMDHPEVIEIWNLVFIQFNRLSDGSLVDLPAKHIDTGMGFERLCMVLQDKKSSYDTGVFSPCIQKLEEITGYKYGEQQKTDIAFRVIVDHIRAIAFTIADGQLPSNTGAGYVIRRILRRAVRYYYNFLDRNEPTLASLIEVLSLQFKSTFPELFEQKEFIKRLVEEEEKSFLRTLSSGLKRLESLMSEHIIEKRLSGQDVFTLYDTYGFPLDLTKLIATEKNYTINEDEFELALNRQKESSKEAASKEMTDWKVLNEFGAEIFKGYDFLELKTKIVKYRVVHEKENSFTQIVLQSTPFYAESGGQQGDKGTLIMDGQKLEVLDTKKENEIIVHIIKGEPTITNVETTAIVNSSNRNLSCKNHSATHLLHAALKQVLGNQVQQKGSSLNAKHLRFDFNHFTKLSDQELKQIEDIVNNKIFDAIEINEQRSVDKEEALKMGANALFGEKYGNKVRVITFDRKYSVELCGGTHVKNTTEIGLFKITQETAVAAGVRRIEAITSQKALEFINEQVQNFNDIKTILNNPIEPTKAIESLMEENGLLKKKLDSIEKEQWKSIKTSLKLKMITIGNVHLIMADLGDLSSEGLKKIAFDLKNEISSLITFLASSSDGKVSLALMISEDLIENYNLNAAQLIKNFAKPIQGGGGGQPFFATAGGKLVDGIPLALSEAQSYFENLFKA